MARDQECVGGKMLRMVVKVTLLVTLLAASALAQWDPHVTNGQVIVHLFEWRWSDIASECENFLGPRGYGGVQVSPPNECVVVYQDEKSRPWWERYQPVSYKIASRSGDEASFKDMVHRCNNAGVRIYVDAVINHMTGWWPTGTVATGGTTFDAGSESYPGVPYSAFDFNDANCYTASGTIENYGDAEQVRNCKLVGLNDLNQGTEYVRGKILEYLNTLTSWGVAGFRIDATKHMWPGDLQIIFESLDDLSTEYFEAGLRPFIVQEVIDLGGEPITTSQYVGNGRVTEFKYGKSLGESFHGYNPLKWFSTFGESWGMADRANAVVFIDNHDNQRTGGEMILTFRSSKWYKMANAYMLAWPYGFTRVMSSYYWDQWWENGQDKNDWTGPPHDDSYNIVGPTFNEDDSCGNGWICEHRWRQIYNMVQFRNVAHGTDMNDWWDNGSNQISFCRGDRGFIAINNDPWDMKETRQTCLTPGTYCDVISGSKIQGSCTGKTVTVAADGTAYIEITTMEEDGVLAIHRDSKL
ncbi:pancreatic alpha-amylase 2a5-like isoform X2 [Panulirus ornatus]|uniref:pancreatic alpha-amylase 2a5-like isoform X2 n=1 Tax=Panulirus ornatus TaxID=150431 RepID=UPI003A84A52D